MILGSASTRSMVMSVHVSQATQVSAGWSIQVQGSGPPVLWEGRVGQVAGGSAFIEQWCHIACIG